MINLTKVNKFDRIMYLLLVFFTVSVTHALAEPGLRITSPGNGVTIKGPDVTVTIELSDVTLVAPSSATKKEELHVIYALDVDTKPFLDGTAPKLGSGANRLHRGGTSVTFKDVAPGRHRVQVILVYSDHTSIKPLVAPSVSFVVE